MHSDHLGSTVLEAKTSGNGTADQKYRAYGKQRDTGAVVTDHKFTGQKLDGTGLQYYNARYYDPAIGTFISPDTLVPDATNVFDYNRYMMARGNPLKFNDPTGHCVNSTTTNKDVEITYDNDECWRIANTIGAMWDDTDYWRTRLTSPEVFFNYVANNAHNGTDFFQGQLTNFLNSEEGATWLAGIPDVVRPEQDFGDYTAINGSAGFLGGAFIFDDYGNVYIRFDNNLLGSSGYGASRGDILLYQGQEKWTDIDRLGLSRDDKAALAPDILVGPSRGGSIGIKYLAAGGAYNLVGPPHMTVEAGVSNSEVTLSYSPASYTIQIYPRLRYR